MSKYYCEYCNFRTLRKHRLELHLKNNHNFNDDFDWNFYLNYYEDLRKAGINNSNSALIHWNKFGKKAGRICNKNQIIKNLDENNKLIKVAFITQFSSIENESKTMTDVFQKGDNNYKDKIIFVKNLEEATHVIIINTCMPKLNIPKANVIGIAWEPNELLKLDKEFFDYSNKNISNYFIGDVLSNYPSNFKNSYTFLTPARLREDYFKNITPKKTKNMSIIFSRKTKLYGHKYRHKLVDKIAESNLNIDIYGFGCRKFGRRKDPRIKGKFDDNADPMKDYKFTISVENTVHPDYISEKFMNAIAFNTVPIYYGGKNVEKYFGEECYYRLVGDIDKDMKLIRKIHDNIDDHLLDLSKARYNLFEGNAYLMKFLYDLWSKTVSCKLMGGLGNQLFQIFATISYALKNNKKFLFEKELLNGITVRKTYWESFLKSLKIYTDSNIKFSQSYKEKNFHYQEIPYFSDSVKLSGYFQSTKYFHKYQDKICKIINLDENREEIKKKCDYFKEDTISIHFRIGDYINLQNIHPILEISYYQKSLEYIINKTNKDNFNILYFCENKDNKIVLNKISFLKNIFPKLSFVKINDEYDDWEQLIIMSLSNHNIIANSSFSWWGAYLNKNNEKIVCCPYKWFGPAGKDKNIDDLFYENWKIIY